MTSLPTNSPAAGAPSSTSLSLLERVKSQDQEAWRRLVQLYGPLVYQWCRRWHLGAEDVADVFQEVFQAVAVQIANFHRDRPGDTFRGWLWGITRHKVGDHFRKMGKQPTAAGGSDALQQLLELPTPPDDDPSTPAGDGVVQRTLEQLRTEFEPRTWQMFWRTAVEGHAPKDIAAELGVTPDAVRMAKSRVLRRLRTELTDLDSVP